MVATLNNLASLYRVQGNICPEAEPLYKQLLEITERTKQNPSGGGYSNNLVSLYHAEKKYAEAERLYKQLLEIKERTLGKEHPDVATTKNSLALLYHAEGKEADAESLYKRRWNP